MISGLGKFPWRSKWQPTPVSFLGNPVDRGTCRLQSVGSQRVGHNLATEQLLDLVRGHDELRFELCKLWIRRRQWHPTPVLLPGKSLGRSLVGYSPWGRLELDMTVLLHFHFSLLCFGGRKWQPTPVFLPGESQGQGSLVGCCLWGRTESDTTEAT